MACSFMRYGFDQYCNTAFLELPPLFFGQEALDNQEKSLQTCYVALVRMI